MEKENVYLCTIWHTGTKYFKAGLEKPYRVSYSHFNHSVLKQIPHYDKVFTTYRDPLRVAASWGNRHKDFKKPNLIKQWTMQWECYREALKLNPMILDFTQGREHYGIVFPEKAINSHSDDLGLHKAIDDENWEYFYRKIPKELMELAQACSKRQEP